MCKTAKQKQEQSILLLLAGSYALTRCSRLLSVLWLLPCSRLFFPFCGAVASAAWAREGGERTVMVRGAVI